MNVNIPPDSPVLALEHNVTWAFENATPYSGKSLSESVQNGHINAEIGLNCNQADAPPQGPFLHRPNAKAIPEMHLSLKHLELLWSFIYSWMVIYESGIQKPMLEGSWSGSLDITNPIIHRALRLREWSASLRTSASKWPADLPSPIHYPSKQEQWYGEKANLVFQQAAAFLLGHEYAHALGKHLEAKTHDVSDYEVLLAEKEADVRAFESLVEFATDDDEKLDKAWAIITALLSSLYLCSDMKQAFRQRRHPPLHHRLQHLLSMLNFQGEQYQSYFPMLCVIILEYAIPELEIMSSSEAIFEDANHVLEDVVERITAWSK